MLSPLRGAYVVYETYCFRNASFSKLLTVLVPLSTLICAISPSADARSKYVFSLSELNGDSFPEILKVLSKLLFFSDLQMIIPALTLIYCFRLIERHFGTSKFMYLFASQVLISTALHFCLARIGFDQVLPCGPIAVFSAMYLVLLYEIPMVSYGSVFGIPLTVHVIPLVMIAQFLSMNNFLISFSVGAIAAALSVSFVNMFKRIPSIWINVEWFNNILEPSTGVVLPLAATIERQRIEAMDEIERQFMRSQMNQIQGLQNLNGSGQNYLANLMRQFHGGENRVEVPESSIVQLMDMGFRDREAVRAALIQSENNTQEAANILLANGQNQ